MFLLAKGSVENRRRKGSLQTKVGRGERKKQKEGVHGRVKVGGPCMTR
jgi:hypothetical protein